MQCDWTDPRDGRVWVVTMAPKGVGGGTDAPKSGFYTVAFHRSGHGPIWTRWRSIDRPDRLDDQALMDLLDAATHSDDPRVP